LLKNSKATLIIALLLYLLLLTIIYSDAPATNASSLQTNSLNTTESIQDFASTPVQTDLISQSTTQQNIQSLLQDNFDDDIFNSSIWEKIEVNGGVVTEKNGRLQVMVPDSDKSWEDWYWSQAGYVTKYPINTNSAIGFETSVNVVELDDVSEMVFLISDQKITDRDPVNTTNWYMLNKVLDTKYYHQNLTRVVSRIDGNISWRVEVPWVSPTGQLKIKISNGSISFYENGLMRYSEPYAFNASECYVYIYTSKWGHYSGTDCFDDFTVYPTFTDDEFRFSMSLSISTESLSTVAGSAVNIFGKLTNSENVPLQNKTVVLSYTFPGINSWIPISSGLTDELGNYKIQWVNSASGTFTLKTEWVGDSTYTGTSNTTTLSFVPCQNQHIFLLESNSTVQALSFNNETSVLSFNITGQSGTTGFVRATIAKNLLANGESLQVFLDGKQLNYTVTSEFDSWVFLLNYSHSTHQISMHLSSNVSSTEQSGKEVILIIIIAVLSTVLVIEIKSWFKPKDNQKT
jgi:hypothetical protein